MESARRIREEFRESQACPRTEGAISPFSPARNLLNPEEYSTEIERQGHRGRPPTVAQIQLAAFPQDRSESFAMSASDSNEALERLTSVDRRTLKVIFRGLDAAALGATQGEYEAVMLHQGGRLGAVLTQGLFGLKGKWTGKAFRPLSDDSGEGYNTFLRAGGSLQALPMDTSIGPSAIDGRPSFLLNYQAKNSGPIRWLVGELRTYQPGVLLGMGTFGPRQPQLRKWRRIIPFALLGPVREYQCCLSPSARAA